MAPDATTARPRPVQPAGPAGRPPRRRLRERRPVQHAGRPRVPGQRGDRVRRVRPRRRPRRTARPAAGRPAGRGVQPVRGAGRPAAHRSGRDRHDGMARRAVHRLHDPERGRRPEQAADQAPDGRGRADDPGVLRRRRRPTVPDQPARLADDRQAVRSGRERRHRPGGRGHQRPRPAGPGRPDARPVWRAGPGRAVHRRPGDSHDPGRTVGRPGADGPAVLGDPVRRGREGTLADLLVPRQVGHRERRIRPDAGRRAGRPGRRAGRAGWSPRPGECIGWSDFETMPESTPE